MKTPIKAALRYFIVALILLSVATLPALINYCVGHSFIEGILDLSNCRPVNTAHGIECVGLCSRWRVIGGQAGPNPTCYWCKEYQGLECSLEEITADPIVVIYEEGVCGRCTGECGSDCHSTEWNATHLVDVRNWKCYRNFRGIPCPPIVLYATF